MKKSALLEVNLFHSPLLGLSNYQGKALTLSSINKLGRFDILPYHINFITLILNELVIVLPSKKKKVYKFERGVLEVNENKVNVFLGT